MGMEVLKAFDKFDDEEVASFPPKSQLQLYLDEPKLKRTNGLDILAFWKGYQFRYPELAMMARDVLSIPILTVASESVFSVDGRVIDAFCSTLRPANAEALICSRDWIFHKQGDPIIDDFEAKLEDITKDIMLLDIEAQQESCGDNGKGEAIGSGSKG